MGNSHTLDRGVGGLRMKEVRLWNANRSDSEISLWRSRQMTNMTGLVAYYRLDEGYPEYTESVTGLSASRSEGIELVSDSSILICPRGTYPQKDFKACYPDFISLPLFTITPFLDAADGSLAWNFDTNVTQLIDIDYLDELVVEWSFDDAILRSIVGESKNKRSFTLPHEALREGAFY
jgi:hypothetical protein